MSAETIEWLNQNTLIGFTDTNRRAWHYSAAAQGDEPNHYPQAVPVADVNRRIFHWQIVPTPMTASFTVADIEDADALDADGNPVRYIEVPNKRAMMRSDTGDVLGVASDKYQPHQYSEWLIDNVGTLLDAGEGEVGIGSAGILKNGAVAWVQIERPESVSFGGDEHRPFLTAATSCDGSLATSYRTGSQRVVCDNTLTAALRRDEAAWSIRHTSRSLARIDEARQALEIAFAEHDQFAADVEQLMNTTVSTRQWEYIVDINLPLAPSGETTPKQRLDRRVELSAMYFADPRVAEFAGTAWGALQAFNTHRQHEARVRKSTNRVEANRLKFLNGQELNADRKVLDSIERAVGRPVLV
jgi:phage/plasmid-like protein (TIGR03299 family)